MKIKVATIFPEMFSALEIGLLGKARQNGLIDLQVVNIRDYSKDKHKKTDDAPFGGGAGMVRLLNRMGIFCCCCSFFCTFFVPG